VHEDVLAPGDLVGEGLFLQGDVLRRVDTSPQASGYESPTADWQHDLDHMLGLSKKEEVHIAGQEEPTKEFEVVRKLGSGSYAVVYLVREVLSRSAHGVFVRRSGRGVAMRGALSIRAIIGMRTWRRKSAMLAILIAMRMTMRTGEQVSMVWVR